MTLYYKLARIRMEYNILTLAATKIMDYKTAAI